MKKLPKILLSTLVAVLLGFSFAACGGSRLTAIEIVSDTTEFVAGDVISAESVSVNAKYADGSSRTVTGWAADITGALEQGEHTVTFTYTENGVTVSATLDVTVSAAEHVHEFGAEWQSDDVAHFRVCACGARTDEAAHIRAGITVTAEADCVTDGTRAYVCAVCDRKGEEKLAALGHSFNIDRLDDAAHWKDCARCNASSQKLAHSLELYVDNVRTVYSAGDRFSLDGATATAECADCAFVKNVDVSEIGSSKTDIGENDDGAEIVLTYGDATTTVSISVVEKALDSIRADADKNKTAYRLDESFANGKLTLVYNNQTTKDIDLTADMVTGFATDTYGAKSLTVEYGGLSCTLDIAVVKDLMPSAGAIKFQAEDGEYVDMNGAVKQDESLEKFESMMTLTNGGIIPNNAEGFCTSNISVKGNKIVVRFYALAAGRFTLGMRAQSASGKGRADQPIADALGLNVNGKATAISGVILKASNGSQDWRDMGEWTALDDIAGELELKAGVNVVEFAFLGETAAEMRMPNIDYFTVDVAYADTITVDVHGDAEIPYGGSYADGLTLTVKNGDDVLAENVPVTAQMISGLDSMQVGEQEITVTYFGITAKHSVNVVMQKQTLTVVGGTFADGTSQKQLTYGELIPEINWSAQNIIGWAFDGTALDNIDGLTMSSTDTTLRAITAADAINVKLSTAVAIRYNSGPTPDDTGKNTGGIGDTSATTANVDVFGSGDGTSFKLSVNNANARGLTFKYNIVIGPEDADVYVFVKIINNSDTALNGVAYGTEIGKITVGDVAANESASAGKIIKADNANHWHNIFWDGQISALDFTVAIYTYALA